MFLQDAGKAEGLHQEGPSPEQGWPWGHPPALGARGHCWRLAQLATGKSPALELCLWPDGFVFLQGEAGDGALNWFAWSGEQNPSPPTTPPTLSYRRFLPYYAHDGFLQSFTRQKCTQ